MVDALGCRIDRLFAKSSWKPSLTTGCAAMVAVVMRLADPNAERELILNTLSG